MKKLVMMFVVIVSMTALAQFKSSDFPTSDVREGIVSQSISPSLFGFINPQNFKMDQSYSMSYSSFGGQGLALGVYTNNLSYKFNDQLNVQLAASVVNAPYSTLGSQFNKSINGVYIDRAAINYKPWKDFSISLEYSNMPYGGYYSPYSYMGGFGLSNSLENPFFGR